MIGAATIKMVWKIYLAQLKEKKKHFAKELKSFKILLNLRINKNIYLNCLKSKKNPNFKGKSRYQLKKNKIIKSKKKILF